MSVACKFSDDNYFSNTFYAEVGGITAEEFNMLEEEYLINYLQFKMYIEQDTYNMYYSDIAGYYQQKLVQKGIESH